MTVVGRVRFRVERVKAKTRRAVKWVQWVRGKRGYGEVTVDRRTWRRWQSRRLLRRD